ncbi:MAG: hypothetical protein MJY45_05790 [Bacteroidales bacterium]|nr:hypothetical protein [Bacteroidales bacterium]
MFTFEDTTAMPVCGRTGAEDFRSASVVAGMREDASAATPISVTGGTDKCLKINYIEVTGRDGSF